MRRPVRELLTIRTELHTVLVHVVLRELYWMSFEGTLPDDCGWNSTGHFQDTFTLY
jgi:hypothetical protein